MEAFLWWKKKPQSIKYVNYAPSPVQTSCELVCSGFINQMNSNERDYTNVISLCCKYLTVPLLEMEHFEQDKNTTDTFNLYPVEAASDTKPNTWSVCNPSLYSASFAASSCLYKTFATIPYTTLHANFEIHRYLNIHKYIKKYSSSVNMDKALLPPILIIDISFKRFPSTQHFILSAHLNQDSFKNGNNSDAHDVFSTFIENVSNGDYKCNRFKMMVNEYCLYYHLDSFNIGNVLDIFGCGHNAVSVCRSEQKFIFINLKLNFWFRPPADDSVTDIALFLDEHLITAMRLSKLNICKINHIPTEIMLADRVFIYKYYSNFALISMYRLYWIVMRPIEKIFNLTRQNLDDFLLILYCLFISGYVAFLIAQAIFYAKSE